MKKSRKKTKCIECGMRTGAVDGICLFCSGTAQGTHFNSSGTPIQPFYQDTDGKRIVCGHIIYPRLTTTEQYHGDVYRDDI